jgi:hypothetical protein
MGFPYLATESSSCNFFYYVLVFVIVYLLFKRMRNNYHHKKCKKHEKFSSLPGSTQVPEERITPPEFDGVCSPKCCLQNQWPVDFMDSSNTFDFSAYEPSGMHCRGCEGSGCLCVPKKTPTKAKAKK